MIDAVPIIVVGAAGRMGRTVLDCMADSDDPFQLIAAVEAPGHSHVGRPLRDLLAGAPPDFPLTDEMPTLVPPGTVAIIFSTAEGAIERLEWCDRSRQAAVIGATGFTNEQRARIRDVAERAPILVAPNMSVGVNALFELVARAVRLLGEGYDCEISEMHHRFKADAPSGTALRLAEVVVESRAKKQLPDVRFGRTGASGPRSAGEIVVHALRGGDVVGEHTVTLAGLGERIELTHRAHTRETFARGALRAARWIYGRPPGLYSMKDVLALDGPPGGAA